MPTPFYVGDVNVYLIREDPVTIIDVGPKTPEAADALRRGLARHGVLFSDIERIVLTHAHEDHCGLARSIRDESKNARVYIHDWEAGHLFGRLSHNEHRDLLLRSGVPPDIFDEMRDLYDNVNSLTDTVEAEDIIPLVDDTALEFSSGSLRVLHTPGHTPGSCSFFREADRTLICGDCVLKRITPNPMFAPDPLDGGRRFRSLGKYLASLSRLRELRPTRTFGGHGEAIDDLDELFHRYIAAIDERQRKVISLTTNGITAYELASRLFPGSIDDDVHRFLAISEAIAHLDLAHAQGKVGMELEKGVETYRKN